MTVEVGRDGLWSIFALVGVEVPQVGLGMPCRVGFGYHS